MIKSKVGGWMRNRPSHVRLYNQKRKQGKIFFAKPNYCPAKAALVVKQKHQKIFSIRTWYKSDQHDPRVIGEFTILIQYNSSFFIIRIMIRSEKPMCFECPCAQNIQSPVCSLTKNQDHWKCCFKCECLCPSENQFCVWDNIQGENKCSGCKNEIKTVGGWLGSWQV